MTAIEKAKEAFDLFMSKRVSYDVIDEARKVADKYVVFESAYSQAIGFLSGYLAALEAEKPADDGGAEDVAVKILNGLYYCGRVWEAWSVGTMHEDDFGNADEDDAIVADASSAIKSFAQSYHAKQCAACKENNDPETIISLISDLDYITGIVEKGTGKKVDKNKPIRDSILAYVKSLEAKCKEIELDDMRHGREPFARFETRSGITTDVGISESPDAENRPEEQK